jgi:mannose-6-phosphate isomerase-like protein (cupin superfamily)
LKYNVPSEGWEIEISQGETAIIPPEVPHYVTPVGRVTFYVEFWGEGAS